MIHFIIIDENRNFRSDQASDLEVNLKNLMRLYLGT